MIDLRHNGAKLQAQVAFGEAASDVAIILTLSIFILTIDVGEFFLTMIQQDHVRLLHHQSIHLIRDPGKTMSNWCGNPHDHVNGSHLTGERSEKGERNKKVEKGTHD